MIPRIRKVYIQNYKSIEKAWATLEPFTVLVGPNGTGKSNFVDALAFVKDCLTESPDIALRKRGGFFRTCSQFDPPYGRNIGIRLDLDLGNDVHAEYAFEVGEKSPDISQVNVLRERCVTRQATGEELVFEVQDGRFAIPVSGIRPVISPDRPALTVVSAAEEFQPVYDFLTTMRFYLVIPDRLREFRQKESAEFLKHDGSNAAAVLERLQNDKDRGPEFWKRIGNLVSKISSGTRHVSYEVMASKRPNASTDDEDAVHTLAFLQHIGRGKSQMMQALYMSDGTLRALALLLAAYQLGKHSVIAIEEPEATIHPAAAEVILQVLQDASNERQILVTTHSPDIIDSKDVTDEQIRIVGMKDGRTFISSVSKSGRAAIRDRLYTPGELLRMDELRADEEKAVEMAGDFSLFEEPDRKESGDE